MKLYPPASSLQLKRTTMLVIMSYWPLSTPWRHCPEGADHPFLLWTDHKNITYLCSAKRLIPHFCLWATLTTPSPNAPALRTLSPLPSLVSSPTQKKKPLKNPLSPPCAPVGEHLKGHSGFRKSLQLAHCLLWQEQVFLSCSVCACSKALHHAPTGLLQPPQACLRRNVITPYCVLSTGSPKLYILFACLNFGLPYHALLSANLLQPPTHGHPVFTVRHLGCPWQSGFLVLCFSTVPESPSASLRSACSSIHIWLLEANVFVCKLLSKSYTISQCKLIIQIVPDQISLFQWRQLHEAFLAQLANHSDYEI